MTIKKSSIINVLLSFSFFFVFAGMYAVLLYSVNTGFGDISRYITVPVRILVLICLSIIFLIKNRISTNNTFILFVAFSSLYYLRIVVELLKGSDQFHLPLIEFFLYFTAFVFLPGVLVSQIELNSKQFKIIFWCIVLGNLILATGSYFYYGDLIGVVNRLTESTTENTLNPLILSYNSALGIGLGIGYLMTNKVYGLERSIIILTIICCVVPFILGASRGSYIALILPFIFYLIVSNNNDNKSILLFIIIGLGISIIIIYLGEGLIERFTKTFTALNRGDYSDKRLQMWISSWYQFVDNPFFGNSLENDRYNFYPHNLFFETLITTGSVGIIVLFALITSIFKKTIRIIKGNPEYFFITIIFYQALIRSLLSGSIYSHVWLAIGMALVIQFNPRIR